MEKGGVLKRRKEGGKRGQRSGRDLEKRGDEG